MSISGYQIATVIKTYLKNMKVRADSLDEGLHVSPVEERITLSEEGRALLFDKIRKYTAEKLKRKA